jgi:hypothetical protein
MDKPVLDSVLSYFLKRHLRTRLINSTVAYISVNLTIYFLLLAVVILTNSSLFIFHLLLFFSLSLLPLFLFLGMERTTLRRLVRSIDDRCLVESYLHTPSTEHRTFMRQRVEAHLERKKNERVLPFRLFRGNLYLLGLCGFAFLLLQGISVITLRDFTTTFSAREIKNRLIERETLEQAVAELPVDDAGAYGSSEAEELRPTPGGETGEQRTGRTPEEETLEELLEDGPMAAKDRIDRLSPEDLTEESDRPTEQSETEWRYQIPGSESEEAGENMSGIAGDEGRETGMEGSGSEAGSGDVGRTFRESPLREYTAIPEEIAARGNEELSPGGMTAESRKQTYLSTIFSDFQQSDNLRITFNPLFDAIRERYLELLRERF